MGTLARIILVVAIIGGLSECQAFEAGISGGLIDKVGVVGAYVKKGKYTVDAHVGMEEDKQAMSVGIYRELFNFSDLGLKIGAGLSTNKVESIENNLKKKRTYQGYDLELNYDIGKFNIRSTVNSNGDIKSGIGFSF